MQKIIELNSYMSPLHQVKQFANALIPKKSFVFLKKFTLTLQVQTSLHLLQLKLDSCLILHLPKIVGTKSKMENCCGSEMKENSYREMVDEAYNIIRSICPSWCIVLILIVICLVIGRKTFNCLASNNNKQKLH